MTNQPIIPFEEWLILNEMKPTKRARKIWAREQEVRPILWLLQQKLGVNNAEIMKMPKAAESLPTPVVSKQRCKILKWGTAMAAAICILCLSVVLPLTIGGGGSSEILYSAELNVSRNTTDIDTVRARKDVLLFKQDNVFAEGQVFVDKPLNKKEPILSYSLKDLVIFTDDYSTCFVIDDYRVRLYKKYNFHGFSFYENLNWSYDVGCIKLRYGISFFSTYLAFTYGGYDYFVKVSNVGSPINEESLTIFVRMLSL